MALEFIVKSKIYDRKKIILPRESYSGEILKYRINSEKKEIEFFYDDKERDREVVLNTWNAPRGAREIEFSIYRKYKQSILMAPMFYASKGNLLKIGNR